MVKVRRADGPGDTPEELLWELNYLALFISF